MGVPMMTDWLCAMLLIAVAGCNAQVAESQPDPPDCSAARCTIVSDAGSPSCEIFPASCGDMYDALCPPLPSFRAVCAR